MGVEGVTPATSFESKSLCVTSFLGMAVSYARVSAGGNPRNPDPQPNLPTPAPAPRRSRAEPALLSSFPRRREPTAQTIAQISPVSTEAPSSSRVSTAPPPPDTPSSLFPLPFVLSEGPRLRLYKHPFPNSPDQSFRRRPVSRGLCDDGTPPDLHLPPHYHTTLSSVIPAQAGIQKGTRVSTAPPPPDTPFPTLASPVRPERREGVVHPTAQGWMLQPPPEVEGHSTIQRRGPAPYRHSGTGRDPEIPVNKPLPIIQPFPPNFNHPKRLDYFSNRQEPSYARKPYSGLPVHNLESTVFLEE